MLGTGIEPGSSLLAEGHRTQGRLQLLPAPPGVLSDETMAGHTQPALAGQPLMCESGDHVTLSRRCSVRVSSKVLACLLKVVAPRAAYSLYLLHQGCSPTGSGTPTRPSQAVTGRPLMCESGDHVTLSRRCSVRVSSPDLACLLKVIALRAAYSSYLLHQGCSPTRPWQATPNRRWQASP